MMKVTWYLSMLALLCVAGCVDEAPIADGGVADTSNAVDSSASDAPVQDVITSSDGSADITTRPDPVCGNDVCEPGETNASCEADCAPCRTLGPGATELEQRLSTMEADTWYEAPNTMMREVCVPDSVGVRGIIGCRGVVAAWSGGAYDTTRDRLLVWGGGHGDYWGNEVYAFDVARGAWSRLTEPSTVDPVDRDPLSDGNPVSRHTYGGLAYVSHLDAMFAHGGSRANDGSGTDITWSLDMESLDWTNQQADPVGPGGYTLASAYDELSGKVYTRGTQNLYAYDYASKRWDTLEYFGLPPLWPRFERSGDKSAVIDPTRRLLFSVGGGDFFVWDMEASEVVADDWVTSGGGAYSNADYVGERADQLFESGGGDIYDASAPGLAYDPVADALVAWANDGGPYSLDLMTKVWTRGSGEGAPTSANSGGTFGRWRYIPAYNVFILMNSIDENVRFYKHTRCAE